MGTAYAIGAVITVLLACVQPLGLYMARLMEAPR